MVVDDTIYPQITTKKVLEILAEDEDGEKETNTKPKKS
jgi:hypothetical protein